jgi:ketosteroid isomerase-like protein
MTRALLLALLLPALALAADAPAGGPASRAPRDPRNEAKAKKEIQELFLGFDDAGERGDAEAAAALLDFPLLVATDGAKGDAAGESWTRERWLEALRPVYDVPLKKAQISHKAQVFLVSDSLATVNLQTTVTKGGTSRVERSAVIVIRKDGEWRIKARVESGWLDVALLAPAPAEPPAAAKAEKGEEAPAAKDDAPARDDAPAKDEPADPPGPK